MNLFLLHRKHKKNARKHCNRHVVKMVLETAQLLWASAHCGGAPLENLSVTPYKLTHKWHPTAIWVRKTRQNWLYTLKFAFTLSAEYTRRYKKIHKCHAHFVALKKLGYYPPLETRPIKNKCGAIKNSDCTPFPCAMPEECLVYRNNRVDAVRSYKRYYKKKNKEWKEKGRPMKYTTKFCV